MHQAGITKAKHSFVSGAWALTAIAALVMLSMVFGMAFAWADDEGESEFSDSVSDVIDQVADEGQQDVVDADVQDGTETTPSPAFDKKKMKVELGKAYLVGFAPEAADAESDDENRVKWHESWKKAVEESKIDLSDESGWFKAEDKDGNAISYEGITGIITEDKAVFELLGEYPEWKVDDKGVEYRWWYGLLGVAKKAGETKLQIVFRDEEGVNHVLDECTVLVVDPKAEADQPSEASSDVQEKDASEVEGNTAGLDNVASDNTVVITGSDDGTVEDAVSDMKTESSTSVSISTAANESSDTSGSTNSSTGTNASSGSSTNTTANSSGSSTTTTTNSGYPKEMLKTLQGSSITASLLANDATSEEALNKLANGATLHLAVEVKSKLGDEAEKSITTLSTNNGVSAAERLTVKVLDTNNSEATISGMNLTVKIVADNAMKALDASSVQVWYVAEDGTTEKLNAKLSGGYLTFDTKHLSDFVVMGKASSSSSSSTSSGKSGLPQTGDPMAYVAIALAFIAGFAASSALNARRRLKE